MPSGELEVEVVKMKMTQEQKIELLSEAVLRLYGNLSILPPRDVEIREMLIKIVKGEEL